VTNPGSQNDDEGEPVSVQIQASDPDSGDAFTFSASHLPQGLSINANTGLISGTPGYNASASSPYNVTVTATDDDGASGNTSFSWTINNRNGPPQVTSPGDQTHTEGNSISLQIQASDPDNGDKLQYYARDLPEGLSIDDPAIGVISGVLGDLASLGSPYGVTVEVIDDGSPALTDSVTFQWTVIDSNLPPQFDEEYGNRTDTEGDFIHISVLASDPDPGDTITFSAEQLPPGLGINDTTGVLSGMIGFSASSASPFSVTLTVTDDADPP
jgi:hypothetical protein